jgi:hypothetical protein
MMEGILNMENGKGKKGKHDINKLWNQFDKRVESTESIGAEIRQHGGMGYCPCIIN